MPNQVIFFEVTRPNADIPWAHEYIINTTDEELKSIRDEYVLLRKLGDGRNGWMSEYIATDDPKKIYIKFTYFNVTSESVNHCALLHYRRILPEVKGYDTWSILYNKSYGIIKTKIDAHNTTENSILNYGDYGRVDAFNLKFQTQQ